MADEVAPTFATVPQKEGPKIKNTPVTLTQAHVQKIFNMTAARAATWFPIIKKYCDEGEINTVFRLAAFLAQVNIETSGLSVLVENLNYSAEGLVSTFPQYFKSQEIANKYARKPEAIANYVYANRMGNGNEASGDGWKYRGRGAIQLTGFYNYDLCNKSDVLCLNNNAPYLESPEGAMRSAVWYWGSRTLNRSCDAGDFKEVCVKVNGGTIKYTQRYNSYVFNLKVLTGLADNAKVEPDPDVLKPAGPQVKPDVNRDTQEYNPTPESGHKNFSETIVPGKAQYPWNQAHESRSGHLIEIDDTPGRERLQWYHRTGTYKEMQPDGSQVQKVMKDDRTFVQGFVFFDYQKDVTTKVGGSVYETIGGDFTTNASGSYTITAPKDYNCNAPNANFSGFVNSKGIFAKFFRMRRGTEFGNVADMKSRDAVHADFAEIAGKLGGNPNPGAEISGKWAGGNWSYSKTVAGKVDRRANGVLGFEPAPAQNYHSIVCILKDSMSVELYSVKNFYQTVLGDEERKTNGDQYDGVGGNRHTETAGHRLDHTGEEHKIKSDLQVTIEAPVVEVKGCLVAKFVVYDSISLEDLPEAAELPGKAVTAFVNGRVTTYTSDGLKWTEI